jgi:hypothetical protein
VITKLPQRLDQNHPIPIQIKPSNQKKILDRLKPQAQLS